MKDKLKVTEGDLLLAAGRMALAARALLSASVPEMSLKAMELRAACDEYDSIMLLLSRTPISSS